MQNREKTTALKACKPADPEGKTKGIFHTQRPKISDNVDNIVGKAVENREISVEKLLKTGEKQDSQKNGKLDIFFDCRCFQNGTGIFA